ncbi:MAG: 2-dehydropantoate 2-reductase [Dehalococcoidia bacterium]|nr:2-dehydropantoate 2-reductase [Dehalococcoidia bacterium]
MRFIVYGAGAVGGVVGGRLHQSGHDVVFIARGAHLDAIRTAGLRLRSPLDDVTLPVPAVASPAELTFRPGDAIILAMKTQDTLPALEQLAALVPGSTPIVCLQNGVENERLALRRFPNVYATAVMLPASHLEPGVVDANSAPISGILDTGRYPYGVDAFSVEFTAALERSTFSARPEPRIMWRKYTKLLMNLGNAVQAALGDHPAASEWQRRARDEAVACYHAAGIEFATAEEDRERRGDLLKLAPIAGQARSGSSSWQSLARGTRTIEANYLNGEIALLGSLHGVATPVNRMLTRVANRLAAEGAPPGSLTPADLEAGLAAEIPPTP